MIERDFSDVKGKHEGENQEVSRKVEENKNSTNNVKHEALVHRQHSSTDDNGFGTQTEETKLIPNDEKTVNTPKDEPCKIGSDVSFISALSLLIGTIIGSGIFASPSVVAFYACSPVAIIGIWIACGIITMLAAMCWIELGTMLPHACGEYSYIYTAFGEAPAFVFAYASILVLKPAGLSILLLTCGDYIMTALGSYCLLYSKIIAAVALGVFDNPLKV